MIPYSVEKHAKQSFRIILIIQRVINECVYRLNFTDYQLTSTDNML